MADTTTTTHLMKLDFTGIASGNNIQIYFDDTGATWAMSEKAGISITPGVPGTPFQCSGFSVNARKISVTPAASDPFTLTLSFASAGDTVTVMMNLLQGNVQLTLPQYGQTGAYSAGDTDGVTLRLKNNI
jgi:hypothetical protein